MKKQKSGNNYRTFSRKVQLKFDEFSSMHMKEDHMRNAQLKPGYNIQFAVEGEYITGVDVSSERSDQLTLISLLQRMENNGIVYQDVTCDAGYESVITHKHHNKLQQNRTGSQLHEKIIS